MTRLPRTSDSRTTSNHDSGPTPCAVPRSMVTVWPISGSRADPFLPTSTAWILPSGGEACRPSGRIPREVRSPSRELIESTGPNRLRTNQDASESDSREAATAAVLLPANGRLRAGASRSESLRSKRFMASRRRSGACSREPYSSSRARSSILSSGSIMAQFPFYAGLETIPNPAKQGLETFLRPSRSSGRLLATALSSYILLQQGAVWRVETLDTAPHGLAIGVPGLPVGHAIPHRVRLRQILPGGFRLRLLERFQEEIAGDRAKIRRESAGIVKSRGACQNRDERFLHQVFSEGLGGPQKAKVSPKGQVVLLQSPGRGMGQSRHGSRHRSIPSFLG